ncbi:MAG: hypothetical protein R3C45_05840 [Phycisphaerales bacterium]
MTALTPTPASKVPAPVQRCAFWFIALVAALVPLESFLISLLAKTHLLPRQVLFGLDFAIEGAVYLALATFVIFRLVRGGRFTRTPADLPLLIILAIVVLSIAINNAPIKDGLMNMRSALRYAALFYLVSQIGLSRRQVGVVLWVILISGAVQVIAGLLQWYFGYDLKVWMLPYSTGIEVAGQTRKFAIVERGREIGSLFGTLGDTLYYGLFLLVVLGVAMSRCRWRAWSPITLLGLLFGIAYSYSRAAVIAAGLTVIAFLGGRIGMRRVLGGCCALAAVGFVLIAVAMSMETLGGVYHHPRQGRRSIMDNMTNIFSAEYLERSKRQRLGTVLGVAPTALMNAPVFGYSPDQAFAIKKLNEAYKTRLYKTLTKEGFEDVYWVALLCYTGLAGVIAVGWLGVRLAWTCAAVARGAAGDMVVRWAGLSALCVVLQCAVLMWFNRVPEIRSFSFYFWLLPALAYAAWADQQANHDTHADATDATMQP